MSDRIAVFNDGVIQQLSSAEVLYEKPENSFVAQFIGENNKLHGSVDAVSNGVCDVTLEDGSKIQALAVNVEGSGSKTTLSVLSRTAGNQPSERRRHQPAGRAYRGAHLPGRPRAHSA